MNLSLDAHVDKSFGLQQITIRLTNAMVSELKRIGKEKGIGYQPLIRIILSEYIENKSKVRITIEELERKNEKRTI